jgi:hypothetical protein
MILVRLVIPWSKVDVGNALRPKILETFSALVTKCWANNFRSLYF